MKANKQDIKKQRAAAAALVYELTGKKLKHLKTGRPFAGKSIDISISHKGDIVAVAAVPASYRIGIDVESLKGRLNAKYFMRTVITELEIPVLRKLCRERGLSRASGIAVFWSIKESFFKCLDCDLKPGKISVLGISKNGGVQFKPSDEIIESMKSGGVKLYSAKIRFVGGYVFSLTIMDKISSQARC